jgi:hypothetical protein
MECFLLILPRGDHNASLAPLYRTFPFFVFLKALVFLSDLIDRVRDTFTSIESSVMAEDRGPQVRKFCIQVCWTHIEADHLPSWCCGNLLTTLVVVCLPSSLCESIPYQGLGLR